MRLEEDLEGNDFGSVDIGEGLDELIFVEECDCSVFVTHEEVVCGGFKDGDWAVLGRGLKDFGLFVEEQDVAKRAAEVEEVLMVEERARLAEGPQEGGVCEDLDLSEGEDVVDFVLHFFTEVV